METTTLSHAVLEHLMRVTADDTLLLAFLDATPQTRAAASALGRLLGEVRLDLKVGSPLLVFVSGGELDPTWRDSYPPSEDSLWSNYSFLRSLYGPQGGENPYEELERLRHLLAEED